MERERDGRADAGGCRAHQKGPFVFGGTGQFREGTFFVSDETFRQQAQLNLASEVRERG